MSANQATSTHSSDTDKGEEYHPKYSSVDATLVIASRDGVKFRVHPFMLRMASDIFASMLGDATDTGEPLILLEESHTIESLLNYIYPNAPFFDLQKERFHSILNLLVAAHKYGVNGLLDEFHSRISTDSYFSDHPISAYVVASRFGWKEEADKCALAAIDHLQNKTENVNLIYADGRSIIKLYRLAELRRERFMDVVYDMLDSHYHFNKLDRFDRTSESSVLAFTALDIVDAYVAQNLYDCPSGKELHSTLTEEPLKKYLFDDWGTHFIIHLLRAVFSGRIPETIDDSELDSNENIYD